MHFCQGDLQSISLFGKAADCYGNTTTSKYQSCQTAKKIGVKKTGCTIGKKDCCHNKKLNLQAQFDSPNQSGKILLNSSLPSFLMAAVPSFTDLPPLYSAYLSFLHYKPPLIVKDLPVLIQSFLL